MFALRVDCQNKMHLLQRPAHECNILDTPNCFLVSAGSRLKSLYEVMLRSILSVDGLTLSGYTSVELRLTDYLTDKVRLC